MAIQLAAAIVVHEDKVLVVRRSESEGFLPGVWGVPCGKIDVSRGERARQAALRELCEETGLTGAIICYVGQSKFRSDWQGRDILNVQRNYLVRPIPQVLPEGETLVTTRCPANLDQLKVKLPESDQEYDWIDRASLSEFGLDGHNLGAIRQALLPWRILCTAQVTTRGARRAVRTIRPPRRRSKRGKADGAGPAANSASLLRMLTGR
jgi:8-oxo-dGTP diphosphatase